MQTPSLILGEEWAKLIVMERHTIMALIELESALTLHSCISVTDNLKILSNEPKNSIAKGPLYLHTEFETNWTLIPEDVAVSNPVGNQVS